MLANLVLMLIGSLWLLLSGPPALAAPPSNSITITDLSGTTQTNRPFTISRVFAQGDIPNFPQARIAGTAVTTQADVKSRWPDSSVKHVLISFAATVFANSSITVDFINQPSGNNSGQLDRSGLLNFAGGNWGGQIEVTNGATLAASARQIISDWSGSSSDRRVTYWLQGPIATQVILEDRTSTLAYDIGWDTYKTLHPIFVVTFYPGYTSGVKVEMILENMWATKLEDVNYSLALKTGNPPGSPVYTKSTFTHYARTRWRKIFWSGTQPGSVKIDYNLPYMAWSKAIPNFDTARTVSASAVTGEVNEFNASDKGDINGNAQWLKYFPTTGGRPDIGVFPRWTVRYLYTFDPQLYNVMVGDAGVSGHIPIHYRESATGLFFDDARTVDAFGRMKSWDAHPDGGGQVSVGPRGDAGWTVDAAHQGSFVYVPYLITGDWYYLEELYFWAAYNIGYGGPPDNSYYGSHPPWGIVAFPAQSRGVAWIMRTLGHAAFMAPDGTPEKTYITQKLNNNIAVREGEQNVTTGAFYNAASGSPWYWGRNTVAYPSGSPSPNPLHYPDQNDEYGACDEIDPNTGNPNHASREHPPWMANLQQIVWGVLEELGFQTRALRQAYAVLLIHQLRDPAFNNYLVGAFHFPSVKGSAACACSGLRCGAYFTTMADVLAAFDGTRRAATTWPEGDQCNLEFGYPQIARAAASFITGFSDGALTGQAGWDWINNPTQGLCAGNDNPKWAFLPRTGGAPAVSCDLNGDAVVDVADVQLAVNQALGINSCGTADLDGNGRCDVVDVQRIVNAALGGGCKTGP